MSMLLWLSSGLTLGLASSLHCAAMCGAISASVLMLARPAPALAARLPVLLAAQAGRITSYALAGALVGLAGSAVVGLLDRGQLYRLLQYASATTLLWIGLSLAGLLPSVARLDAWLAPLGRGLQWVQLRLAGAGLASPFAAGLAWGMIPCGMVYAALFTAMLTGRPEGGLMLMLGFGVGTVPSVAASALGIGAIRALGAQPGARVAVGLAIAGLGLASLWASAPGGPLCISPGVAMSATPLLPAPGKSA